MRPASCFFALLIACTSASAQETQLRLPAKQTRYHLMQFPANEKLQMTLQCDKNGEVDIFVLDADCKIYARTSGPANEAKLSFTTKDRTVRWLVKIVNLSPHDLTGTFKVMHNPIENAPIAPVEVAAGKKSAFYRYFEEGKVALLQAEHDSKTPLELSSYDVENHKIATDAKGHGVAFYVKPPNIYRVVLANNSKDKIACKFKLTSHDVKTAGSPTFDLAHDAKQEFALSFPADKLAAIWVTSDKDTDVDLMVYDDKKEVVSDITIGKDCFVGWLPAKTATYRVVVVNHGFGANRCVLKHNGAAAKK